MPSRVAAGGKVNDGPPVPGQGDGIAPGPAVAPRLSICIATRNRGDFIGETLRSIAAQNNGQIEIVVLDGASTDDTPMIVQAMQAELPYLRYLRKEQNGGVDRDYDEAVGLATGDYCWLMSDDDLMMPGALAAVFDAVNAGHCLVVVNSEVRNSDMTQLLDANRLQWNSDRCYSATEFQRLFKEASAYLTYIGAVVIRRDLWGARQKAPYYGSYFIHVGVIFQKALPGTTLVVSKPCISVRFGNTQWRPKEFEIRMVRWTELVWSFPEIERHVLSDTYPRKPWHSFKSLLFYRAKGTYGVEDYHRWVKPRSDNGWQRLKGWCIAVFPGPLANLAGLIYCSFEYRDSNIHYLDMKASRFYFRNWSSASQRTQRPSARAPTEGNNNP